jgi:hypothetical protein
MRRWLPIIVLLLGPLLGFAGGTITAWIVHPKDEDKKGGRAMEDVAARGDYILWGSVIGAGVGLVGAFLVSEKKAKK